jgi:hypothetical protein
VADGADESDKMFADIIIRSLRQYLPSKVAKNLFIVDG